MCKWEWEFIVYAYSCNHFPYSYHIANSLFPLSIACLPIIPFPVSSDVCCNYKMLYHHVLPGAQTYSKIFHRACNLWVKLTEHFPQQFVALIRMQHNSNLGCLAGLDGVTVSMEVLILHEEVSCIMVDSYNVWFKS